MKKGYYKFVSYIIVGAIISCSIFVTFTEIEANDFEGNEEYWTSYCSGIITDADKIADCNAYSDYIEEKLADSESYLDSLTGQIDEVEDDLSNLEEVSQQLLAEIEGVQSDIDGINESIAEMEENILILEESIEVTLENIELRKDYIKERMVQLQVSINTNQYFDYIMGAADFLDLVRKISSINLFTANDSEQIELLNQDIEDLNSQMAEQERLLDEKEIQAKNLVLKQNGLEILQAENAAMQLELEAQIAALFEAQNTAETAATTLVNLSPSFAISDGSANVGDVNSSSIIDPISNSYISRGIQVGHRGVDYAASMGTPIIAPADCYIVFACTGYGTGWLGNMDGPSQGAPLGGGNSIRIMFSVNGVSYAMNFHHLQSVPDWIIDCQGQNVVIAQGTTIGYVGSSGNSSGAHAHVEMFVLAGTIQEAIATWYTTGDWQSGCGWGLYTPASSSYATRVDPEDYL